MKQDPIKTIGTVLQGEHERDAIHVAIMPVQVQGQAMSGDSVKFVGPHTVTRCTIGERVGIIDPFLGVVVSHGDHVWLFLPPGSITSLRHDWTCPDVDAPPIPSEAKTDHLQWLQAFAHRWGFDFHDMIAVATDEDAGVDYIVAHGVDLHDASELGEDHDLFWYHLEGYTGKTFGPAHRGRVGWSCSC